MGRLVADRGHPERIITENGPEFTSKILEQWAYDYAVELQFIPPGKTRLECFHQELQWDDAHRVP